MGMTIVEKILARASEAARVAPGQLVVVEVETTVFIDTNFYASHRRELLKVHDPDKIVVVLDHLVPAPDLAAAEAHVAAREFVRRFGIRRFHDSGPEQGVSHALVAQEAYALPGTVLVCPDSHTCAAGALNCAARGVGYPDTVYAATTGKAWFRLGETIRYDLVNAFPAGVSAKDAFLFIAGQYGDHANQNVEFGGSGLEHLSMSARCTLATMGAELSAEFVTFEPDAVLLKFMQARTTAEFAPQSPDPDAVYATRRRVDLATLQPMVAFPDAIVKNCAPIGEAAGIPIHQAFIGSCANGTLDDLAEAARVVAGRRVAPGVRLIVTPATQRIFREAVRLGYVQTLADAGAVVTPAGCGVCFGGHMGVLGPGETCITASTRNFKGRMGDPSARIYMASPATVAASAVAGHIVHPAEMETARS